MIAVLIVTLLILLFLTVPIFAALALSALVVFAVYFPGQGMDLMLAQSMVKSCDSFPLMAIPFFMLVGTLMSKGGLAKKLVDIAEAFTGNSAGGLGTAAIVASMLFAAISGSGPATAAAIGGIMIPAMVKQGYGKEYSASLLAAGSTIGPVIPPSIPMIMFAVTIGCSTTTLFMAGVIPGILVAVALSCAHFFLCRNLKTDGLDWSFSTFLASLKDGFWSVLAPVIILGGIYAGVFTPTEAAIIAIFYTIIVGIFIHKELSLKSFMASLRTTSWLTGRVLVLVFTATAFGYLLTSYRIPVEIANWILSFTNNVYLVWFFVVVLLLFLGMFMETLAIIMLVTPVLLPIMMAYGVDPIHFGIVLICCCGIGFSTPPLGENMFIASGIANVSLEEISLKALPLVASNILVIVILVLFPDIVLLLPNLMGDGLQ